MRLQKQAFPFLGSRFRSDGGGLHTESTHGDLRSGELPLRFDATAYQLDAVYLARLVYVLREVQFAEQRARNDAQVAEEYNRRREQHGYPKAASTVPLAKRHVRLVRLARRPMGPARRPVWTHTPARARAPRGAARRRTRVLSRGSPSREPDPPLTRQAA